ncbi:MAG: cell surface protein [Bacteroidetes bacterium]|nr:cell surface protein [Bacteroidota bacterium]
MDARDIKTMRDLMPVLTSVDLSGVNIAAYTGIAGTYNTSNYTYPANTFPRNGFYNKSNLSEIILPANLTTIARSGLNSCTSLAAVSLPSGMKTIGYLAFRNCSSLNNITIPATVNVIDTAAFLNCESLSDIDIPASVTFIGNTAFIGTNANISVNSSNAYYSSENGVLYDKNKTILMFCPPKSSSGFKIPASVTEIDIDAFYNCSLLDNITLPNSLTTIKQWAFENCTGLSSVTIPASITQIQGYAFYKCSGLNTIFARSVTPVDLSASDSVFKYVDVVNCTLYVPAGSKSYYQNAVQWKEFQNIVEEDITIDLNKALTAWYPFNGNANDESGNGNNGTIYGATLSPDRFGKENKAYYFNGSNYITIDGIIDDLYNKESYSVTGWFKSAAPEYKGTIFSLNKEKNIIGQNISMIVWENNLTYYSDSITNSQYHLTPFDNNIWHFFALTFTKNQISRLYIDNNILHHTFISNNSITPNSMASIGQEWDNDWTSDFFVGWIDDIRVYSRILNSSEINNLYMETATKVENISKNNLYVYPNPANKGFYLSRDLSSENISLYDMQGVNVLNISNPSHYVDISNLQQGVYIVRLRTRAGVYSGKLIKK